ncbi:sperm-associated antigen hypothetical protein [Limosa lapponica baueri]|uniref:Uncharacterized protein n=1 Tax=Limosa lapponica baueri TaxID=1758121 RepID=A0A2I0TAW1_LIMLA|nr:sperm-associated antigen hypothetical protein [Limosa lapponica baueri]
MKLNTEECAIYTNRALCYLKLYKYEEAKQDCDHVLQIEDSNIKAFYRRALAYKGLQVRKKNMAGEIHRSSTLCLTSCASPTECQFHSSLFIPLHVESLKVTETMPPVRDCASHQDRTWGFFDPNMENIFLPQQYQIVPSEKTGWMSPLGQIEADKVLMVQFRPLSFQKGSLKFIPESLLNCLDFT